MKLIRPSVNNETDNLVSRLIKYIPAESILLYQTARGIILSNSGETQLIVGQSCNEEIHPAFAFVFWSILILTPLYTYIATSNNNSINPLFHTVVATLSFPVWVLTLGDVFNCYLKDVAFYSPLYISLLLLIYTAVIAAIEAIINKKTEPNPPNPLRVDPNNNNDQ